MNQEEFRDLCILLSCDYNKRIKGFPPDGKKRKKSVGIGAKHSITMIREYRRLEEVCKHVDDCTPLIYRRCRELFTVPEKIDDVIIPIYNPPNEKVLAELIKSFRLSIGMEYIKSCWKPTAIDFLDDSTEELFTDSSSENEEFDKGKEEMEI